ncbi:hypothetical protein PHSC3_000558 [Chlamydiales bacterium STE3]|nr:hypothetical protein PHSC3_000558 [Chlamydiales bacterium STE3]
MAPYPLAELQKIASECSLKESAAEKVERKLTKCALVYLLIKRVGESFQAIVTGANGKGV